MKLTMSVMGGAPGCILLKDILPATGTVIGGRPTAKICPQERMFCVRSFKALPPAPAPLMAPLAPTAIPSTLVFRPLGHTYPRRFSLVAIAAPAAAWVACTDICSPRLKETALPYPSAQRFFARVSPVASLGRRSSMRRTSRRWGGEPARREYLVLQ